MPQKKRNKKKGGGYYAKFNPLKPRSGRHVKKYLKKAARLEYGPTERALSAEKAASDFRQSAEIPTWFAGYQNQLATLRGEGDTAFNQAIQNTQNTATQANQQDTANAAEIQSKLQKDAELRGTSVSPTVGSNQANATAARSTLSNLMMDRMRAQQGNQSNLMANRMAAVTLGQREAQDRQRGEGLKIDEDIRALAKDKGAFKRKLLDEIIESERKWNLENAALAGDASYNKAIVKQAKLGVKKAKVTGRAGIKQAKINKKPSRSEVTNRYPGKKGKKKKRPALGKGK